MCDLRHYDIDTLYGVAPQPIEQLPARCICGAGLTYAEEVAFVAVPEMSIVFEDDDESTLTSEPVEIETVLLSELVKT